MLHITRQKIAEWTELKDYVQTRTSIGQETKPFVTPLRIAVTHQKQIQNLHSKFQLNSNTLKASNVWCKIFSNSSKINNRFL